MLRAPALTCMVGFQPVCICQNLFQHKNLEIERILPCEIYRRV